MKKFCHLTTLVSAYAVLAIAGCASVPGTPGAMETSVDASTLGGGLRMTGDQEVPPVSTQAIGAVTIAVSADGAVQGVISIMGMVATMAHIHLGAPGVNGPAIVTMTKTADGKWRVPANSRLSAEQLKAYRAGGLYVNVHSDAHKDGEIRTQLRP